MAKLCKFGSRCTRPDCWFSHPAVQEHMPIMQPNKDDCQTTPVKACKDGAECAREDCWFSHPAGRIQCKAVQPCRDGAQCSWADCRFRHPPDRVQTNVVRPCRDGAQCTRADCWFSHPADRVQTNVVQPCKDGIQCTRADCWFSHPPNRPDPNSEAATRERYSRSVFVGQLSIRPGAETSDEDLYSHFAKFGEIVVASVSRLNKEKAGKSRGFGLVEFRHCASADQAIRAGHPIWNIQRRKFQSSGGYFSGSFLSSTKPGHHITLESETLRLHPHEIRFTHGRISFCFKDGKKVDDTIEKCLARAACFEDAPPLQVVQNPKDGCYYSLSNRRLFVARVLASKGHRFGAQRNNDTIEVRLFPFSNKHVKKQWTESCRTIMHKGQFAVPAWRRGTCKQAHVSKYIEEQVATKFRNELRTAIHTEAAKKQAALLNAMSEALLLDAIMFSDDSACNSDFD